MIHYGIAPGGGVTGPERTASVDKRGAGTLAKHGATIQSGGDSLDLNRLTDQAEPRLLNTGGVPSILTANKTLWMSPMASVPKVREDSVTWIAPCQLAPNMLLGDTSLPTPPSLAAPVGLTSFYDPRKGPGATRAEQDRWRTPT